MRPFMELVDHLVDPITAYVPIFPFIESRSQRSERAAQFLFVSQRRLLSEKSINFLSNFSRGLSSEQSA